MQTDKTLSSLLACAKPVIGRVDVFDAITPLGARYCSASW